MKRALSTLGLALAALITWPVRADEGAPTRTAPASERLVVVAEPDDVFGHRVVAELEALGFRTSIVAPTEAPSRASLEAVARAQGAVAAIRGVASERGVEVWIADRATGKTVLRELPRGPGEPDDALALRTVELLRASMLEASLPTPPPSEVAATPELRERLQLPELSRRKRHEVDTSPMLRFAVAPAGLFSPGGLKPTFSLALGLAFLPTTHFGVSGFLAIPVAPGKDGPAPTAVAFSPTLGGGALRFGLATRGARWTPTIDAGLAVVALSVSATRPRHSTAHADSSSAAAPYVGAGLGWAVTPNVRVRADLLVVVAKDATIASDSQLIGTWGTPIVMPSLGLDAGWF